MAPELRAAIERNCIGLLAHREFYLANGVPLRRGIVLHGPPGTGKTTIGRALARRCGVTFILATPGMVEEPEAIRRAFKWAKRFAPTILFFEDFDLAARARREGAASPELGEFLSCIDGVDSGEGVITIATTNDLQAIDPALRDRPNRLDVILEVPALSEELRREFLERWRARCNGSFNVAAWAKRTKGSTGAQMQELLRTTVMLAVEARIDARDAAVRALALADADLEVGWAKLHHRSRKVIGFQSE